jgi:hypothetical protein
VNGRRGTTVWTDRGALSEFAPGGTCPA